MKLPLSAFIAIGALAAASQVHAQSSQAPASKPSPATPVIVSNTTPIPVSVVPAAPERWVVCVIALGSVAESSPFTNGQTGSSEQNVRCADGVTKVDVRRLTYAPDIAASVALRSDNLASYRLTVAYGSAPGVVNPAEIRALLTDGQPVADLTRPFIIDTQRGNNHLVMYQTGTSGIAGMNVRVGGSLLLEGVPVQ